MTRPRKQTVDYFPHDCNHGKTMFIIEQRYGNNGYAFWFKLLELLGKTQGHFLDLGEISVLEYLASVTRITPDLCIEIVNLLARLEAIDRKLWESKIVWSDNFVSRITDVYRNRVLETPIRPDNLRKKPPIDSQSDACNPQTKLNETKLNKPPYPLNGELVCVYCGVNQNQVDWAFDKDHFIPLSAGGTNSPDNLLDCCHVCNQIKQKRLFQTIDQAREHIHRILWEKNRQRYIEPRKIMFGGNPPAGFIANNNTNGFDSFWLAYPKKIGKGAALKKWEGLRRLGRLPPLTDIISAVERQKNWEQWQKDEGQFIPNPTTWLNQSRWDDEQATGGPKWIQELSNQQSTS